MMSNRRYNWKRFWCPPDGMLHLTDDGYLWDPESDLFPHGAGSVVAFESIATFPCLGLLGEPGMGKSTEMRWQYELLNSQPPQDGEDALWRDLRNYTTDGFLHSDIFEHPKVGAWLKGTHHLHLFLDSLDEGLLSVSSLATLLPAEIGKLGPHLNRLSLRIACRTLEWPAILEQQLKELWGRDAVKTYELAPLRRTDVAEAARSNGIDPDAFLEEIERREAVPLAMKPVTLAFLLGICSGGKGFPATRGELYEHGCRILCDERNPSRLASRRAGALSAEQRFVVAARLAALTVFGNRAAIWTGADDGSVPDSDLRLAEACGGNERLADQDVQVTPAAVRETLDTGLFNSRGPNRMGWAHQSYGEFLAAWYLVHREMPLNQMMSLIVHPDAPGGKLVPQLYEAAAWLADMVPPVLDYVVQADPQVLLQSDLAVADLTKKTEIVRALLERFDREELVDTDLRMRSDYRKLAHPGLVDQLRPYIVDRQKGWLVRRVAVDIAEACELKELQDDLLQVALNLEDEYHTRVQAAYALARIADQEVRRKMLPLAYGQLGEDPDDELKGCALQALWPSELTTAELFSTLAPPNNPHLLGAYEIFLHDLGQNLAGADLPAALDWVKQHSDWGPMHPLRRFVDGIVTKAWEYLGAPEVLGVFAETVVASLKQHHYVVTGHDSEALAEKVRTEPEKRHSLILAMLPLLDESDARALAFASHGGPALVTQDDLTWLIEELEGTDSDHQRSVIAELIRWMFVPTDPDSIDRVYLAAKRHPVLWAKVSIWFETTRLDSPESERSRRQYLELVESRQEREERQRQKPDTTVLILKFADELEGGDRDGWWHLNWAMAISPEGHLDELESDLTALPGWQQAREVVGEQRLVQAAYTYLLERDPEVQAWLGGSTGHRPALAGYRALRLLAALAPDRLQSLPNEVWQKWAATVLAYPTYNGQEAHQQMVALAYQAAPEEIISALMVLIDKDNEQHDFIFIIREVEQCWDERLAVAVLAKAREPHLKPPCMKCLLAEPIKREFGDARAFAEFLLSLPIPTSDDARSRAIAAGSTLMTHAKDAGWPVVWPAMQVDVEFGHAVVSTVASNFDPRGPRREQRLADSQLADLYVWVARQYPHVEDSSRLGGGWVGPREQIARWRDSLLTDLQGRGTASSCAEMKRIVRELPEVDSLKWHLLEAQEIAYRKMWEPPIAAQILELVRRSEVRLVRNGDELLEFLVESLGRLQKKLQGELAAVEELWNEKPRRTPKDEDRLSDCIARYFGDDLKERGVVAAREVQVRRGQDTDIHVDAITQHDSRGYEAISATVEVKGCWHAEVGTAMETQLADRYLRDSACSHGLYVVGWFMCSKWDDVDYRKKNVRHESMDALKENLEKQAADLSTGGILVRAVVLDTSLH